MNAPPLAGKAPPPPLGPLSLLLRLLGPMAAAIAATWALDWLCRRKGLMPPGFRRPWRRAAAAALVFFILWVGIFGPLGDLGLEQKLDLSSISTPRLFLLHALMAVVVLGWFALGFAGVGKGSRAPAPAAGPATPATTAAPVATAPVVEVPAEPAAPSPLPEPADLGWPAAPAMPAVAVGPAAPAPALPMAPALPPAPAPALPMAPALPAAAAAAVRLASFGRELAAQLGLVARNVPREVAIGLLLGACAWGVVLLALAAAAVAIWAVGGEEALPKPSAIVPWIAALPVLVRVMVSLSAGFVEEIFFRGFLQPRIGIALSTGFFVLAHLSYGQPFMLLGITLLSLIYAFLVRWRQTIWPSIAAHALFDGIQLLLVIPAAMRLMGQSPR